MLGLETCGELLAEAACLKAARNKGCQKLSPIQRAFLIDDTSVRFVLPGLLRKCSTNKLVVSLERFLQTHSRALRVVVPLRSAYHSAVPPIYINLVAEHNERKVLRIGWARLQKSRP